MNHKEWFKIKTPNPVCIGAGLIVLDVVINGDPKSPPKLWTGGSCGNVLTILSYLGWKSYPLARLRDDVAAEELVKDLKKWKVRTSLISRNGSGNTPIIIEKIGTRRSGVPWHRFEWVCPNCGSWFPRYKPILARDIGQIGIRIPRSQVFFFDRVLRSSFE